MITAGVDCGAKTVKVVVLKGGKIAGMGINPAGIDVAKASKMAFEEALLTSKLKRQDIEKIVATGLGKKEVTFRDEIVTEVSADARGGIFIYPSARTIIDVGAEEVRSIRVDESGRVLDFAINDKCAAGTGAFIEAMARALELDIEDMGPISLKSTQVISINAQCAVFAESEIVTLLHAKTSKPDMVRAIHLAIAGRIASIARRVGIVEDCILIGGLAKNIGFVDSLNRELGVKVKIPEKPEFVGAIGAALLAEK
jgi:benzoyl-CoA reductase subunit D